jgi:uncharacterized metal-binding protein YceD (DUF177 family)
MSGRTTEGLAPDRVPAQPWSVPVKLSEVSEDGRTIELAPDATTREAVARFAGVIEVSRLEAGFNLSRIGSDSLRVVGQVSATVVQRCVVTLEPMSSEVEEEVNLVFAPSADTEAPAKAMQSIEAEEPLEELRHGAVDLGAIATEFLVLGIDPYPRKPGVTFDSPVVDDPAGHPFAALAALKTGSGKKDS